ncbi:MAG TPA: hypothetical protein PKC76_06215 [Saprospiraceae bacterium]|nr:hypothetical protein [Saprospiraceae bacterium]HMP23706.1 hypothetical protein [Saprospiraceae bacterium]
MFLINWFQANLLMFFTTLVLLGIPVVIAIIIFSQKTKKTDQESGLE